MPNREGKIVVFTGPMFSRKTKSMAVELDRNHWRKRKYLAFKPAVDLSSERTLEEEIARNLNMKDVSHLVFTVSSQQEIENIIKGKDLEAVAFDETQFFDSWWIVDIVKKLAWEMGIDVLISGLDLDYRRESFGQMPMLLNIADEVHKLTAVCFKCGKDARFTKRIAGTEEQVQVEGKGKGKAKYEARCGDCFYEYRAPS